MHVFDVIYFFFFSIPTRVTVVNSQALQNFIFFFSRDIDSEIHTVYTKSIHSAIALDSRRKRKDACINAMRKPRILSPCAAVSVCLDRITELGRA